MTLLSPDLVKFSAFSITVSLVIMLKMYKDFLMIESNILFIPMFLKAANSSYSAPNAAYTLTVLSCRDFDSSGFEHVFVGEIKGEEVVGFHNWICFYLQEKAGNIDYHGYFRRGTVSSVRSHLSCLLVNSC